MTDLTTAAREDQRQVHLSMTIDCAERLQRGLAAIDNWFMGVSSTSEHAKLPDGYLAAGNLAAQIALLLDESLRDGAALSEKEPRDE